MALLAGGCGGGGEAGSSGNSKLLIWTDATRAPGFKSYAKAAPGQVGRIVTYDASKGDALKTKIQLFNRSHKGWPDVVFDPVGSTEVGWAAAKPYDYAEPLDGLVPASVLRGFPAGALKSCTLDGKLYCLPNDLAPNVLWYDAKLLDRFGYEVPKTWEEYQALGLRVAKEHPGYTVGSAGQFAVFMYFQPSGCPTTELVSPNTVKINLSDPNCTRTANMLDTLLKAGSLYKGSPVDTGYMKLGAQHHVLMQVGAAWFGDFIFKPNFKPSKHEWAAAPSPHWSDQPPSTSTDGGGVYMVSKHAKDKKAAARAAVWMATSDEYQVKQAPTYPAYSPAAAKWCDSHGNAAFYATNPCPVIKQMTEIIKPLAPVRFGPGDEQYIQTVGPAADKGSGITGALPAWEQLLAQLAKANGYQVTR